MTTRDEYGLHINYIDYPETPGPSHYHKCGVFCFHNANKCSPHIYRTLADFSFMDYESMISDNYADLYYPKPSQFPLQSVSETDENNVTLQTSMTVVRYLKLKKMFKLVKKEDSVEKEENSAEKEENSAEKNENSDE